MAPTLRSRRRKSRGSDEEDERSILQLQDDAAELPTLRKELKALKAELAAANAKLEVKKAHEKELVVVPNITAWEEEAAKGT